MPRTRKINLEGDVVEMENQYGAVKQLVRMISLFNVTNDRVDSVSDVDKELAGWYERGYKLVYATTVGHDNESINMFYVLAKE